MVEPVEHGGKANEAVKGDREFFVTGRDAAVAFDPAEKVFDHMAVPVKFAVEVDRRASAIHVRRTAYFEPKTEESQRVVDLAPFAVNVIRSFKEGSRSEFVLEGSEPYPSATYDYYRCDRTWRDLHDWLHSKGIRQRKAIHALRKESGSLVASASGIEAARQHLGHRDIHTTSAHYVDKRNRIEVRIPFGAALQSVTSEAKMP